MYIERKRFLAADGISPQGFPGEFLLASISIPVL